jgi:transposase
VKKHSIQLTKEQRRQLEHVTNQGMAPARKIKRAQILLKVDEGEEGPKWTERRVQEAFGVGKATIWRVKALFRVSGLEEALSRKMQPERPEKKKITGEQEARILQLACTRAPEGYEQWSIRLLTQRIVEVGIVLQVGRETVRLVLRRNELKPWQKEQWCIPPEANEEFVYHMEDVLDVYQRPYDPRFPQVCLDEGLKELHAQVQEPIAAEPGMPKREDYHYAREGVCSIFLANEPLRGKRYLQVTERRTKKDWALFVRDLLDRVYPDAEKVLLVMDHLNTHTPASFYEAFPAEEARRLTKRLEIHYTPKHGSWLNMAEIELSVLGRQCLSGRIASREEVQERVRAWQERRNCSDSSINWRFTTEDARIKLKRLYPSMEERHPASSSK